MAFKTSAEIFGDGGGFGPVVPYSTTNPPGTSAGNRGIQFGEQLTAAIANRTHYALALNDEDLNTRLAAFEVGGLDAAYDNGSIGPSGGGRQITKDGGAVETVSTLAASYADDIANAHLRANSFGNAVRGGGGVEAVGWARGTTSPLFGLLDRRGVNFGGATTLGDSVAVNLGVPDTITITGVELFSTAGVTSLNPGYDLIEILSGAFAGVYVLNSVVGPTACTVRRLDGTVPAFVAGATTVRVCRATFGSFTSYGHNGALGFAAPTFSGLPGTEAAADFIASKNGRYDLVGLSPDASRYALRVLHPTGAGTLETKLTIDGHAQVRSAVSSTQQTSAQLAAAADFGVAAFVAEPSGLLPPYEAGFVAKRGGATAAWFGFAAHDAARPPTTPGGSFAFNFINILSLNVELADVVATDWNVSPTVTLVEITSPSANAGIYRVDALGPSGTGRLTLVTLAGGVPSFPLAGAGTLRILYGVSAGSRAYDVGVSALTAWTAQGKTGLMVSGPKEVGGAALVLESGNRSAAPADYFLIRGISENTGAFQEVFSVTSEGDVAATGDAQVGGDAAVGGDVEIGGNFLYSPQPAHQKVIFPSQMHSVWAASSDFGINIASDVDYLFPNINDGLAPIALNLPTGATVIKIVALVSSDVGRAGAARWRMRAYKRSIAWAGPAAAPVSVQQGGDAFDTGAAGYMFVDIVTSFTVNGNEDALVIVKGPSGALGAGDRLLAIAVVFSDPGPRNTQ